MNKNFFLLTLIAIFFSSCHRYDNSIANQSTGKETQSQSNDDRCIDEAMVFECAFPESIVYTTNNYIRYSSSSSEDFINAYTEKDTLIAYLCNTNDYDKYSSQYDDEPFIMDESNSIHNQKDEPLYIYSLKNYEISDYLIVSGYRKVSGYCPQYNDSFHEELTVYKNNNN